MDTGEFNGLLCPVCNAPVVLLWTSQLTLHAEGGFCHRGEEDEYSPGRYEFATWKVECHNEHVLLTARDEWPGCYEAKERGEVDYSDEEGWGFDITRTREHLASMAGR